MRPVLLVLLPLTMAVGPLESTAIQSVRLDTGIDRGLTSFLSYNRTFSPDLALEVRFGLPLVAPDPIDSELSAGAEYRALAHGHLQLRTQIDLFERTTENGLFTGLELGARGIVRGGYFACHFFVAAELGVEHGFATYIHHSDWYRDNYPEAENGWLANPATIFKPAILGGGYITPRILLAGQLGIDLDRTGTNSYLPIVATVSAAVSF